jgi:hypothetical protein
MRSAIVRWDAEINAEIDLGQCLAIGELPQADRLVFGPIPLDWDTDRPAISMPKYQSIRLAQRLVSKSNSRCGNKFWSSLSFCGRV